MGELITLALNCSRGGTEAGTGGGRPSEDGVLLVAGRTRRVCDAPAAAGVPTAAYPAGGGRVLGQGCWSYLQPPWLRAQHSLRLPPAAGPERQARLLPRLMSGCKHLSTEPLVLPNIHSPRFTRDVGTRSLLSDVLKSLKETEVSLDRPNALEVCGTGRKDKVA